MRRVLPQLGETEVLCQFLFFPLTLKRRRDGRYEKRWLERACIEFVYTGTKWGNEWLPISWSDEEETL